jgi:hypothetical protein
MQLRSLLIALALTSTATYAQETPQTPAEKIAQSLGLEQLLLDRKERSIKTAQMQTQLTMRELGKAGLPTDAIARLTPLMEQMVDKVAMSWDPKEAAMIYANGLSELLTPQELSEAERYYGTKDGKKSFSAVRVSIERVDEYISSHANSVMQTEFKEFIRQAQQAVTQK